MPVKQDTMETRAKSNASVERQNAKNITPSPRRHEGERISKDPIQVTTHKVDTKKDQSSANYGAWGPVFKSRQDFVEMHLF